MKALPFALAVAAGMTLCLGAASGQIPPFPHPIPVPIPIPNPNPPAPPIPIPIPPPLPLPKPPSCCGAAVAQPDWWASEAVLPQMTTAFTPSGGFRRRAASLLERR